jgi:hypothetical protein
MRSGVALEEWRCEPVSQWRAAKSRWPVLFADVLLREPKVSQLDVPVVVNQHILWLQIAVYDTEAVKTSEGESELCEKELCLLL